MALDSVLYHAAVPTGTYAVGDIIPLSVNRGPAVVRDGYGQAVLKKIFTAYNGQTAAFKIVVRNSNWDDSLSNPALNLGETALDENSASINRGHDCRLIPNSTFDVYAECITAGTTTADYDLFCLMDIDYPSVPSVTNPRMAQGTPMTIDNVSKLVSFVANGTPLTWTTTNVDVFKAGYEYLLTQVSYIVGTTVNVAFLSISGAAGQNGLERIIPVRAGNQVGIKYLIDYTTPLVKGPMNISFAGTSPGGATTGTPYLYMDFVKRRR